MPADTEAAVGSSKRWQYVAATVKGAGKCVHASVLPALLDYHVGPADQVSSLSRRNEWAARRGAYSFMQMSLNRMQGSGAGAAAAASATRRLQAGRNGGKGECGI